MTDSIATLEVAPVVPPAPQAPEAAPATVAMGFVAAPPVARVAVAGQPRLAVDAANSVSVPLNTPVAFIWGEGIIASFEYGGRFRIPFPPGLATSGGTSEIRHSFGAWDQTWNSPVVGPVNPRPGTVYRFSFDARKAGDKDAALTVFLTSGGTQGGGFFESRGGLTLTNAEAQMFTVAGVRGTSMTLAWDRTLGLRIFGDAVVSDLSPIEFIRPELSVSDTTAIDLGIVKPGQPSEPSPPRRVTNSQSATVTLGADVWCTLLYGTAHVTAPADKPFLQAIDDVGVELVGESAALFEFAAGGQSLKLLGADGKPGLQGGETPESETFAVHFRGSDKPGTYAATQAANTGTLSKGAPAEPLAGLYYLDLPVRVSVRD